MKIIKDLKQMQETSKSLLREGHTIGFVPTMGALHEGHLSLVRRSLQENDTTVVSIFVNPTQFGPSEDYHQYPRDPEGDTAKLQELGVDILFSPSVEQMYPQGYRSFVVVEGLSEHLCGAFRPGHFRGVATVVTKLFNLVKPTRAYFGLKDYQQGLIIKTMVKDLNMDIEVVLCPTIREKDGLAMSSRNQYLSSTERKAATVLFKALTRARDALLKGEILLRAKTLLQETLKQEPLVREIQYASVYDPMTLEDISDMPADLYRDKEVLLAIAVFIGKARLIDNMLVKLPEHTGQTTQEVSDERRGSAEV